MHNVKFLLEELTKYSNLLLATLTAVYVWLTFVLIRENNKSSEKHFRILTLPHLFCKIYLNGDQVHLVVYNTGHAQAYNVDLLSLISYSEDNISVEDFSKKYMNNKLNDAVNAENEKLSIHKSDEGIYSVYDRVCYFHLPTNMKVDSEYHIPIPPFYISLLLQYCDLFGNNFVQLLDYCEENGSYKMISKKNSAPEKAPRIELGDKMGDLVTEDRKAMPKHIKEHFVKEFKTAISAGYLRHPKPFFIEDRGEWSKL